MEWANLSARTSYYLEMGAFSMGTVSIYDEPKQNLLLYAKSRLLKWKGLKVFSDKEMQHEMLAIIQDFEKQKQGKNLKDRLGAIYTVTDTRQGQKIAHVKYKFKSLFTTNYDILDLNDQPLGEVVQTGNIFASRMLAWVQPQFDIIIQGRVVATLKGKFAFYKKKYFLDLSDTTVDIRLIMTAAVLVLGMEKIKSNY